MDKVARQEFAQYLQEARSWETDQVLAAERSRRIAWRVATGACALALVAVLTVGAILPACNRTELRVVRVDQTTGIVDVINEIPDGKQSYGEAVDKYFVQLYVRYREAYSRELAEEYYYNTGLMSAEGEQRRYYDHFSPRHAGSPLNVYGTSARVRVSTKSVSFIKSNVALVRYTRTVERGTAERPTVTHWAATVVFEYTGAPMSERDRAINPLGFQVTEYRNDPDAAPPALPAGPLDPVPARQPADTGVVLLPGLPPLPPATPREE